MFCTLMGVFWYATLNLLYTFLFCLFVNCMCIEIICICNFMSADMVNNYHKSQIGIRKEKPGNILYTKSCTKIKWFNSHFYNS